MALTQKLNQDHRAETDGVHHLRRGARESFEMPDPPMRQEEFPFEFCVALPEGVQPLPVRCATERSTEPPRTANFHAPSSEPLFPGRFVASEANRAACEIHLLQKDEFSEAESGIPHEPPELAENVFYSRHRRR